MRLSAWICVWSWHGVECEPEALVDGEVLGDGGCRAKEREASGIDAAGVELSCDGGSDGFVGEGFGLEDERGVETVKV